MMKSYPENSEKTRNDTFGFQIEDFEHCDYKIFIRTIFFWPTPLSGRMSLGQKSIFKWNVCVKRTVANSFLWIFHELQHPAAIRCSTVFTTIVFEKYQESTTNRSIVTDKHSI